MPDSTLPESGAPSSPLYSLNLSPIEDDLKKLLKTHHHLKKLFEETCQELEKNPRHGRVFEYLPPAWQGVILRCEIGGKNGFRLVYYWRDGDKIIHLLLIFQRKDEYPSIPYIVKKARAIV